MQRGGMVRTRLLAALALVLSLAAGCTLIDQRTFNPQAGARPKPPPPAGPGPALPLVTIDFGKPNPQYAAALHQAVADAIAIKPDVAFDVVTVVPGSGTPAEQVAAATGITADAREIARAINGSGVDDDRIHLEARSDPAVTSRQVQVFVH